MRFMMMVKATKESEAGVTPSEQLLAEMGRYNQELVKAGVRSQSFPALQRADAMNREARNRRELL